MFWGYHHLRKHPYKHILYWYFILQWFICFWWFFHSIPISFMNPHCLHRSDKFFSRGRCGIFFTTKSYKDPSDRTFSWKESILLVGLEELLNHHATATFFLSWYSNSYIRSISPHKKIKPWEILGNPPSELAMMVFSIIQKRRSDSLYLSDPQIPIKIHQTRQNDWMFSRKFCCFPGFECFWNLLESRSGFTTVVSKV